MDEALARYAVETEGHVRAFLWKRLAQTRAPFTLDVEDEVHALPAARGLARWIWQDSLALSLGPRGCCALDRAYALDVRGLGQSLPEERHPRGLFPALWDGLHVSRLWPDAGQSYLGRRVYDVLCTMDLLAPRGRESIHLYGRGQGALLACLRRCATNTAASVTLKNGPRSCWSGRRRRW